MLPARRIAPRFARTLGLLALFTLVLTAARAGSTPAASTLLVSKGYNGDAALTNAGLWANTQSAAMSADGRYVAFLSNAANIAEGADGRFQVFVRDRSNDSVVLVSRSTGGTVANQDCQSVVMSADGRYVAFSTYADNLVTGDTNNSSDVFVRDLVQGVTQRVSVGPGGAQGNNWSADGLAISGDGNCVVFSSAASTLVPGVSTGSVQVYLRDLSAATTEMISVSSAGAPSDADSYLSGRPTISADGRYVAFPTAADNLVAGDTNGSTDVFLRDRRNQTTVRLSVSADGTEGTGTSWEPAISGDGRYVAFSTEAGNLVGSSGYTQDQVCVRDLQTGALDVVSVTPGGTPVNGQCGRLGISADGRYISFFSEAPDVIANAGYNTNVYVRDRQNHVTTRVSEALGGGASDAWDNRPDVTYPSQEGRFVLFTSVADDLVAGNATWRDNAYVRDRSAGSTERVSVGAGGLAGVAPGISWGANVSADGRYVAYLSDAINLVPGDINGHSDAFEWDRVSGVTTRVSLSSAGAESDADVTSVCLTPDGRFTLFECRASTLVPDAQNDYPKIFLHDRVTGSTELVSLRDDGSEVYAYPDSLPAVSADGRYVAFIAAGPNTAPGDTSHWGVYVRDRLLGRTECVSVPDAGGAANGDVDAYASIAMSADGRYVAFPSGASNLVAGDTNGVSDIFVRDRVGLRTERVSIDDGVQADRTSMTPSLSADGRYVAFTSYATNFIPGGPRGYYQVYVRDRQQGTLQTGAINADGTLADSGAYGSALSADGRRLAFNSDADNLVSGDTNQNTDVFLRDLVNGTIARMSVPAAGGQVDRASFEFGNGAVSGTGAEVVFGSSGSALTSDSPTGGQSIYLRTGSAGGTPLPPSDLVAALDSPLVVRLTWADTTDNEALFRVERSADGGATWTAAGVAGANLSGYVDGSVAPKTPYLYRVRAANEDGDSVATAPVTVTTGEGLPAGPVGLTAMPTAPGSIQLTWTDTSDNETAFEVERRNGSAPFAQIGTTAANQSGYTDLGLPGNAAYTYRVRAHNGTGDSAYSDPVNATTLPLAPSGVSVYVVSSREVRVTWSDPNGTPATTAIERSGDGGSSWGAPITVAPGTSSWYDDTVQPRTTYAYRLHASGPGGASTTTAPASATTPPDTPAIPSALTAVALSDTEIRLNWSYSGPAIDGIRIYRAAGGSPYVQLTTVGPSVASYVDTGLPAGSLFRYYLQAFAGSVNGGITYEVAASTFAQPQGKLVAIKSINFGKVAVGSAKTLTITVTDGTSASPLAILQTTTAAPFTIDSGAPPAIFIAPGSSKTLTIHFAPTRKGAAHGALVLNSTDPKHRQVKVTLIGTGN